MPDRRQMLIAALLSAHTRRLASIPRPRAANATPAPSAAPSTMAASSKQWSFASLANARWHANPAKPLLHTQSA
eukprot:4738228-Alexandrium_andersonii.AAC.1